MLLKGIDKNISKLVLTTSYPNLSTTVNYDNSLRMHGDDALHDENHQTTIPPKSQSRFHQLPPEKIR